MRVLLIPSAYAPAVGGVEELTSRLAEHLVRAADTVEVWTVRHPSTLSPCEVVGGTTVRRFPLPLPRMKASELVRFPGVAIKAFGDLERAARILRPDILHVQCFSGNGVYAAALSARLRVPLVVSLQGETVMDDNDIYDHSLALRSGLRGGLRRAAAVTACSQFVLSDAERRFGLAAGAGVVVPNGVDDDITDPRMPLELPFRDFVLGLGRVVPKKGFDLLLSAFAQIAGAHPSVGLVIAGEGAAREALIRRVAVLGLADRVVLPGTLSRGGVGWAMENAAVFVLPSRVEPFGIVVLEALRGGRPTIVSSRGGASEIVRDGLDGLVVDPLDVRAMAAAISRLLGDDQLRRRFAAEAAPRAREFSWDTITARYREIYRRATAVC